VIIISAWLRDNWVGETKLSAKSSRTVKVRIDCFCVAMIKESCFIPRTVA
jgi:hypothetical protein